MKKYAMILAAFFLAFSFTACSQNEVPAVVKTAFSKKFPSVKKADWSKEGKTEWEAEFELNEKDMSANFDLNGNWKETETSLEVTELPVKVQTALKQQFAGFKIKEAAYTETPTSNVYEVIVKKGSNKTEVLFDAEGNVVKKEKAEED